MTPKHVVVSLPKSTTLKELETYASRRYGGVWRIAPNAQDCWRDEENENNFCWVLVRGTEISN